MAIIRAENDPERLYKVTFQRWNGFGYSVIKKIRWLVVGMAADKKKVTRKAHP